MSGDPSKIDPVIYGLLKPSDQKLVTKKIQGENDLNFQVQLAENPQILTKEWLFENRKDMTTQTYISLTKELNSKGFKEKQFEATFDSDALGAMLISNGLENLVNPKSDEDKQRYLMLSNSVKDWIYDAQIKKGKPLNRTEKLEVMDQVFLHRVSLRDGWFSDTENKVASTLLPKEIGIAYYPEIPANYRAAILEQAGSRKLSEQQINIMYQEMKRNK